MVEHHVANVVVAGSSPVSRSLIRRHSQVVKAAVCKTAIHRFESGCRLLRKGGLTQAVNPPFYFLLTLAGMGY